MAIDPANIDSGINSGAAQVFKPYESKYGEEIARIGQQKRKEQNSRQEDIYGDLGKQKTEGIFFKHKPIFAQKQADLYDYVKQNIDKLRKGDAQATIDFHSKLNQLGTDIGLSKNVAESYKEAGKDYMSNPDKYRPEVLDKLHGFEGYNKETGQFENVDPSIMQQSVDLNKYTRENVAPILKDKIEKGLKGVDVGNGKISTKEWERLPDDIKRNAADQAITDPHIYSEIHYQLKKQNPNVEPTKEDISDYYYQNHLKGLFPDVIKQHVTAGWKPESGGSKGNYSIEPIEKNVTLNDYPSEDNPDEYSPVNTKVKSWELKSNIPIEKEIADVYNPATFTKEKPVGSQKFTMSSIVEHTVDKKTGKPVMVYHEDVIKKHPELYEKKKFASGIMGTGKEAHPVYVPLDVVKPTLDEKKISLNGIDNNTSNYTIKGKQYTHSDLNKMGYTDDQIESAKKAGKIK